MKAQQDPSAKALAKWSRKHHMKCLNIPGTVTYSRSRDPTKFSSTIDLTFVGSHLQDLVLAWHVLDVEGFVSDHRVIQTTLGAAVNAAPSLHRTWKHVNPVKFNKKVKAALAAVGMPALETIVEIDFYGQSVVQAMLSAVEAYAHKSPYYSSTRPARTHHPQKITRGARLLAPGYDKC